MIFENRLIIVELDFGINEKFQSEITHFSQIEMNSKDHTVEIFRFEWHPEISNRSYLRFVIVSKNRVCPIFASTVPVDCIFQSVTEIWRPHWRGKYPFLIWNQKKLRSWKLSSHNFSRNLKRRTKLFNNRRRSIANYWELSTRRTIKFQSYKRWILSYKERMKVWGNLATFLRHLLLQYFLN